MLKATEEAYCAMNTAIVRAWICQAAHTTSAANIQNLRDLD